MTDGPTDQPASAQRLREPRALGLDPGRGCASRMPSVAQRLGDDRDGHRRDGPGRPIRVEPGDDLGPRDREPDAQAGERVGLAGGPDDDEVRVARAQREERGADELRVGLVEDDDRRRPVVRRGVGAEPREERPRSTPSRLGQRRSGCSGCTARRPRRPARRRATASTVEGPAVLGRASRDGERRVRLALLGQDPVHRVGRGRARRPCRRPGRNALATRSRISSAPAPTRISSVADAVAGGRRLDQPPVVGRRVLGQARLEPAGGAAASRRASGGAGEVFRSNRTIRSSGTP